MGERRHYIFKTVNGPGCILTTLEETPLHFIASIVTQAYTIDSVLLASTVAAIAQT